MNNSGNDTRRLIGDPPNLEITLERIDSTIINYLSNVIQPVVSENNVLVNVPVIYANPEKWKSIQVDGVLRDEKQKIQCPIIAISQMGITPAQINSPVNKYVRRITYSNWSKKAPYDKWAVLNHINPDRAVMNTVLPDYIDIKYKGTIWAEYVVQLNGIIEQINFESQEYWGNENDFKFRANITGFDKEESLPAGESKLVRATFDMNVRGYLLPEKMVSGISGHISTTQKEFTVRQIQFSEDIINNT